MALFCALLLAYLSGSISFGLLLARLRRVDLRSVGSGNIGATNAARAMGKGWGLVVLVFDAAKAAVPLWVAHQYFAADPRRDWILVGMAGAAFLGHLYPVFARFRGGKGVATALGAFLAIEPKAAGLGLLTYVAAYGVSRISSVGSLCAVVSFPLWLYLLAAPRPSYVLAGGLLLGIVFTHRSNIRRAVGWAGKAAVSAGGELAVGAATPAAGLLTGERGSARTTRRPAQFLSGSLSLAVVDALSAAVEVGLVFAPVQVLLAPAPGLWAVLAGLVTLAAVAWGILIRRLWAPLGWALAALPDPESAAGPGEPRRARRLRGGQPAGVRFPVAADGAVDRGGGGVGRDRGGLVQAAGTGAASSPVGGGAGHAAPGCLASAVVAARL